MRVVGVKKTSTFDQVNSIQPHNRWQANSSYSDNRH